MSNKLTGNRLEIWNEAINLCRNWCLMGAFTIKWARIVVFGSWIFERCLWHAWDYHWMDVILKVLIWWYNCNHSHIILWYIIWNWCNKMRITWWMSAIKFYWSCINYGNILRLCGLMVKSIEFFVGLMDVRWTLYTWYFSLKLLVSAKTTSLTQNH